MPAWIIGTTTSGEVNVLITSKIAPTTIGIIVPMFSASALVIETVNCTMPLRIVLRPSPFTSQSSKPLMSWKTASTN